ncbi:hypothetical protein ACHAQJ_009825 [Trichoderma viride]
MQHGLLRSSVETLPGSAPIAPFAVVAGVLAARTLRFQKLMWVGWGLLATGIGLYSLMKPSSNGGILYGIRVISAIGAGLLFPTPLFAIQATQKGEDVGIATSIQVFMRSLGQAFGVAIGGVIFENEFDGLVRRAAKNGLIPQDLIVTGSEASSAYPHIKSFPTSLRAVYQDMYADSLRTIWYVLTALAGVGFVVGLAARNESLDKGLNSKHKFEHGNKSK